MNFLEVILERVIIDRIPATLSTHLHLLCHVHPQLPKGSLQKKKSVTFVTTASDPSSSASENFYIDSRHIVLLEISGDFDSVITSNLSLIRGVIWSIKVRLHMVLCGN